MVENKTFFFNLQKGGRSPLKSSKYRKSQQRCCHGNENVMLKNAIRDHGFF